MSNKFKLVPVEPTEEMLQIGCDSYFDSESSAWTAMASAYKAMLAAAPQPPALGGEPDLKSDDSAIHTFSKLMAHKMASSAEKGRSGWQQCSQDDLSRMLREHVEKGDPVDVENFCMMLCANGFGISKTPEIELNFKPYGWVVGSNFYTSRSAAIEEAEKTPCIDVYTRTHLAPLQAEIKRLEKQASYNQDNALRWLEERDQVKAQRDELEHRAADVVEGFDGEELPGAMTMRIRKLKNALSKPVVLGAISQWVKCSERLPECPHECTSDHTMVSHSVLVTDSADPTSLGMAHMRADGTWKLYGGDYDFMTPERITHWRPWPALLGDCQ